MTTFILHGGKTSRETPNNDLFFQQFTQSVNKKSVKILMCYFAMEKNRWQELFKRDSTKIKKHSKKEVDLHLVADMNDLCEKIASYDVLYVAGGNNRIKKYMDGSYDLAKKLENKVYIGSSMGAFIVTMNYVLSFDYQNQGAHQGLGILPFNTLCHWDVEKQKERKLEQLKKVDSNTPVLTLNECEFITMYL